MKRLDKILSVGLSLALCAALVAPAMAHIVTIEGGDGPKKVDTVQQGVDMIAESASRTGTITMDIDEEVTGRGVTIHDSNVTLDLNGQTLTNNEQGGKVITVDCGDLTLQDSSEGKSGKVEAAGDLGVGVYVNGGTADISGGAISGGDKGVYMYGGTADISGGTISGGDEGVYVRRGEANISGGVISGVDAGVYVYGGEATISGGTVSSGDTGVCVIGGTLTMEGGTIEATDDWGEGVAVENGTFNMKGGTVSSVDTGVYVNGGALIMEGGAIEAAGVASVGVNAADGTFNMKNGAVKAAGSGATGVDIGQRGSACTFAMEGGAVEADGDGANGVTVSFGGTFTMEGGEVKGTGFMSQGVYLCFDNSQFIMTDGVVTGDSLGVGVFFDSAEFTMDGGTVGSTAEGGMAVCADYRSARAMLNRGTIYGEVGGNVTIDEDNVTIKPAPYVKPAEPERPNRPDVDIDDPDVPLAGPVSLQELLEELHRRAGASGEVLAWAVDNGLAAADADGAELVTVGALRAILSRYAEVFGTNAVAVPDLVTLAGEDGDLVLNCGEVLAEFFGEE